MITRLKRAIEGSGINRNLAAACGWAIARGRPIGFATVTRSMRRFGNWCTTHRKTGRLLPRISVEPHDGVRPTGEPALGESEA